jgi:hypothetical protein
MAEQRRRFDSLVQYSPHVGSSELRDFTASADTPKSIDGMARPVLPVELWHLIRRFATLPPGPSDTQPTHPLDLSPPSYWEEHYIEDLALKKAISLVCKSWRHISAEYVFGCLEFSIYAFIKDRQSMLDITLSSQFRFVRDLKITEVGESRVIPLDDPKQSYSQGMRAFTTPHWSSRHVGCY